MDQEEKCLLEFYESALAPFLGRRKHFVLEWPLEHNSKVFHKAFHCPKPQRQEGQVKKPRSSPNFCLQVDRLIGSMRVWKNRFGKAKTSRKNQKHKKTIWNGLTPDSSHRIVFFGFPGLFGQLGLGTPKNLEKNKTKKQSEIDLPQILLTGLFLLFFPFSSIFWAIGAGDTKKPREKRKKPRDTQKLREKQKNQKNLEWTYSRFFSEDYFFLGLSSTFWTYGNVGMEKREKTKDSKTPMLPAVLSVDFLNTLRGFSQKAIATGVLTSKKGGGRRTTLRIGGAIAGEWTWCWVPS